MCYVITLTLPPETIISRATAITVRFPALSPGGVLIARELSNVLIGRAQGFLSKYFVSQAIVPARFVL